ncbi:MAG: hypothetical protein V1816_13380 [Pseudomonadota bacterium]
MNKARAGSRTKRTRSGATLLYVIVAITIFSTVAVGLMSMTTSSTYTELMADSQSKAMRLAEAGFNYAAMIIEDDATADPVGALDGQKITLAADEAFELQVAIVDTYKYGVVSTGIAAEGSAFEARYALSQHIVDLTDSAVDPPEPLTIDFTDLGEWIVDPNLVDIGSGISSLNVHNAYSVSLTQLPQETVPNNSSGSVRTYTMLLDKALLMKQAWAANNTYLHYDVQVKVGWGYLLDYGAQGISFRYHESTAYPGRHETYGLSFMRYQNSNGDHIPQEIKPLFSSLSGRPLLVLWKQWVNASGITNRTWMAYRDLTGETYVKGGQWRYDGQCVTDNSSLMVRLRERKVGTTRYNDIQVFFGDSSIMYGPLDGAICTYGSYSDCNKLNRLGPIYRTPDQISYDVMMYREVYYPEYAARDADTYHRLANGSPFPIWAPGDATGETEYYNAYANTSGVSLWTVLENDYFTQMAKTFTWSGFNTAGNPTMIVPANIPSCQDQGTIRDPSFTSPLDPDDFPVDDASGREDRYEVGLHFYGKMGENVEQNKNMYYDDFAIQWMGWDAP